MNTAKIVLPTDVSSGCMKLKELLKRYNMPFEERQEGNAIVIGIKARRFTQKAAQLFTQQPATGTVG